MNTAGQIRLILLGDLQVLGPNGDHLRFPTRHCGFVLAMLALTSDHHLRREAIAGCLWGERDDTQARASLRQTIHHLQKTLRELDCPALQVERDWLTLLPDFVNCDLWDLYTALKKDPSAVHDVFKGELLPPMGRTDPAFDEWISAARRELSETMTASLRSMADKERRSGTVSEAERAATLLLKLDPYDEDALRLYLETLADQGRYSALAAAYAEFSGRLHDELGTRPEQLTRETFETLTAERDKKRDEAIPHNPPKARSNELKKTVSVLSVLPRLSDVDPEAIRHAAQRARSAVELAAKSFDAEVLAVAGNTIDVVFGGSDHEGHGEDAVRCAWRLAGSSGEIFQGLGIVSGEIILADARAEPTSVGVLISRAGEFARLTTEGGIFVAEAVAKRAEGFFEFEAQTTANTFRVKNETDARNRWQARGNSSAGRFVARQGALSELNRAADRAELGDGRVVGVVGEAGIGKSRLVTEFVNSEAAGPFQILTLTASAHDRNTPFGPLRSFLIDWISAKKKTAVADDTIDTIARRSGLAPENLFSLTALIGGIGSHDRWDRLDGQQRRRRIIDLVRAIVELACQERPVILVAEDLHWLDADTEQLLQFLIDDLTSERLLIVATYRPDYAAGFVGRSVFHLIRLEALSAEESDRLIVSLVGSDPSLGTIRRKIAARTGGVPLFIEESVHALADTGVLIGETGNFRSGVSGVPDELPATVQDVLSARITKLSDEARQLLQCAAVFGSDIEEDQLVICGGLASDVSDAALRTLLQAELLVRVRHGDRKKLRFRHALIEEVAYRGLLNTDRRRLHRVVFDLLSASEPTNSPEQYSALARHAEGHGNMRAAAQWHERVGDLCADLCAYAQSTAAYLRALDAVAADGEPATDNEIRLRLKLRPVLVPQGKFSAAITQLEMASELSGDSDHTRSADILISKSYIHSTNGELREAIDEARRAGRLRSANGQSAFEAKLALGQALSLSGAWKETLAVLEPTLAFWEKHRLERFGHTGTRSVWCHGHLSHAHAIHGDFEAAIRHADRAGEIAIETRRPLDRVFADHRLGEIMLLSGRSDDAVKLLERAFAMADSEAEDAPIFRTWFACDLAPAYLARGRLEDAASVLAIQHENAKRMELEQFGAWIVLRKAELAMTERDLRATERLAEQALNEATRIGDLLLEPSAMRVMGLARRADFGRNGLLDQAAALAVDRGFEPELAAIRAAVTDRPSRP